MKKLTSILARSLIAIGITYSAYIGADNQTPTISEVLPDTTLPFRIKLVEADFELPMGVQSYIPAIYRDKFLILTGRIDGLHGFVPNVETNFPPNLQNTNVFVIDPITKKTYIRSWMDPESGLTQEQIDLLSVTAAQGYQKDKTLYITGGYGFNTATGNMDTKNALTAINIPGLIHWVVDPSPGETAAQHIRQIFDDTFTVTGGYMHQTGDNPTLLVMGHEFDGFYGFPHPPVFQQYTDQIRRFRIVDDGVNLSFIPLASIPPSPGDPNFNRRDLNVLPIVRMHHGKLIHSYVQLSGVFTPTTGVWTVPVEITEDGIPTMADPTLPGTFKQGMNNYDCATFALFSEKRNESYLVSLGGMTFGYFQETVGGLEFVTDPNIPFTSQTTTIRIDKHGKFTQHFMRKGGFPLILSETVNPGNPLLFGSECEVIFTHCAPRYKNDVVKLDKIKKPTMIGYIVGGIESTMMETESQADSFPSKRLFKVIVEPVRRHHNHCSS